MFLLMLVLLSSCVSPSSPEILAKKAVQKFKRLSSYHTVLHVRAAIMNLEHTYTVEQWYKAPDLYRAEVKSPENLAGYTVIIREDLVLISHPQIGQTFRLSGPEAVAQREDNFLNCNILTLLPETALPRAEETAEGLLCLTFSPLHGKGLFTAEKLFINQRTLLPERLDLFDQSHQPVVTIIFVKWETNRPIPEEWFAIPM